MAIYHLSASIVKRSAGRSATAAAAYRAADKIEDQTTGITHNYNRKQGVDYSEILIPKIATLESGNGWITDRAELWNTVEKSEKRKDAQLAREITIALPIELERDDQIALVREYVERNFTSLGMVADVNLHHLNGENPHAHILLTLRNLDISPDGEIKFGLKNTDWNDKNLLLEQRKSWEEITNKYLADNSIDLRIDCRSLEDQGSPYIPQIHIGVHAWAMEQKGITTERGDRHRQITQSNQNIAAANREKTEAEENIANVNKESADKRAAIRKAMDAGTERAYAKLEESKGIQWEPTSKDIETEKIAEAVMEEMKTALNIQDSEPKARPTLKERVAEVFARSNEKHQKDEEQPESKLDEPKIFQEIIDFFKLLSSNSTANLDISKESGRIFRDVAETDPKHYAQLSQLADDFEALNTQISMPIQEFIKALEDTKKVSDKFLTKCDSIKKLDFNDWYSKAKVIGKSEEYLNRIIELSQIISDCYGKNPTAENWKSLHRIKIDQVQPALRDDLKAFDMKNRPKKVDRGGR